MPDPAPRGEIDRRTEAVATWLRFANVDLAPAETLLAADRDDIEPWIVAYHAQQCVEVNTQPQYPEGLVNTLSRG